MSTVEQHATWQPLDYAFKPSPLDRAARWYNTQSRSENPHIRRLAAIAMIAQAVLLAMTVIGIPIIVKFTAKLKRIRSVEKFQEVASKIKPPKVDHQIALETKTQTFNHVASYVIHKEVIWHRPRKNGNGEDIANGEWTPIYFDGWPDLKPVEIKADGANLIVIDNNGGVHYKKVVKERFGTKDNIYYFYDISTEDNWSEQWFNFPVLHRVVNLFTGKRLHLPGRKAWGIAHKGQFAHYMEDGVGHKYLLGIGVTTLYVLDEAGKYIYLFDPWKPKSVKVKIPVPSCADSPFIAENMSVSGSTVMLIGYRVEKEDEKIIKKPEIRTMLLDIDSLGWTPVVKYTYDKDFVNKSKIVGHITLPVEKEGWKEIPLPEDGEITSKITIIQTGQGNSAREMRLFGKKDSKNGYWSRGLQDVLWTFHELNSPFQEVPEEMKEVVADDMPDPTTFNWKSDEGFSINDFNHECVTADLSYEQTDLLMHRRDNLIKQCVTNGKTDHVFDLVIPDRNQLAELPDKLKPLFKNKRVIQVKVKQEGDTLRLVKKRFFRSPIIIKLNKKVNND